ncbi:MAG: hypothetical protein ACOCPS_04360 [Desulfonatronovibrio sp.]
MILEYTIYDALITSLGVLLLGCSFTVPALAFLSEIAGIIRQKVFMDKFARQTARLGLLFVWAVFLSGAGLWAANIYYPDISRLWTEFTLLKDCGFYLGLGAPVLFTLYYLLWDKLKKAKVIHLVLGGLAVISSKLFLILLFWSVYRELLTAPELMPEIDSIFLPMLAQTFLLCLSGASALALIYLLARRNRDDYGRDYYRFALGFGAKWALFFGVASPLSCVWLFLVMKNGFDFTYVIIPGAVYVLALIIMVLVLWRIIRSDQPLRNKAAIGICPVLVWIILVFRLVSYLEFTNMVSDVPVVLTFVREWPVLF